MKHLFSIAALLTAHAASALAQAPDVSGTWQFEVETQIGTGTPTFTFKQDGGKLSGRYKGQLGEADVTGSVKGNEVAFTLDATLEGNSLRITYTGTVDKDAMKGIVTFCDLGKGTFKGVRKAP